MKKRFAIPMILIVCLCSFSTTFSRASDHNPCLTDQDLTPIKQVGMYLDGYHTYKQEENFKAENQKQIRTAHYCKQVNPDMFQCLLYDGNGPDAKVIGIEYVITDKLFKTLPQSEQKYWHPHDSEVDSGLLTLPGLPKEKQKNILATLRSTHGKTWQVWPNLSDKVPFGEPVLMWNVDPYKISKSTRQSVVSREAHPAF